jgi:hypothetical protein
MKLAVTVGRAGSKTARVRGITILFWAVKIYKLVRRKKDGLYTWRFESMFDIRSGRWPSNRLMKDAKAYADQKGLPFYTNLKHNDLGTLTDLERIALEGVPAD